jgi:hypothetical protein
VGRVPIHSGFEVRNASHVGGQLHLELGSRSGDRKHIVTDHVLAATGYRVDVDALPVLDPSLASEVRRCGRAPALTAGFETSVPGLYAVGMAAANTFGPVVRFVYGTEFTARRLTRKLHPAISVPQAPVPVS